MERLKSSSGIFGSIFFVLSLPLCLFGGLLGCAKASTSATATNDLTFYVYAHKHNSLSAGCLVYIWDKDSNVVFLEDDAIVACEGTKTVVSSLGYEASFLLNGQENVRVTITRPKTGTTFVKYADFN